jgi:prolipoprotein diacylglyceryltransferase
VVRLARLGGVPVHPTPLYSMLWNAASGLVLLPLWFGATLPLPFICGVYLMLNGLGRFVEESYRGEPQTPRKLGLPIYQWNAVVSLAVGALLTCIDSGSLAVNPGFGWHLPAAALAFALIAAAAMGADFPASSRRFSRLA